MCLRPVLVKFTSFRTLRAVWEGRDAGPLELRQEERHVGTGDMVSNAVSGRGSGVSLPSGLPGDTDDETCPEQGLCVYVRHTCSLPQKDEERNCPSWLGAPLDQTLLLPF